MYITQIMQNRDSQDRKHVHKNIKPKSKRKYRIYYVPSLVKNILVAITLSKRDIDFQSIIRKGSLLHDRLFQVHDP